MDEPLFSSFSGVAYIYDDVTELDLERIGFIKSGDVYELCDTVLGTIHNMSLDPRIYIERCDSSLAKWCIRIHKNVYRSIIAELDYILNNLNTSYIKGLYYNDSDRMLIHVGDNNKKSCYAVVYDSPIVYYGLIYKWLLESRVPYAYNLLHDRKKYSMFKDIVDENKTLGAELYRITEFKNNILTLEYKGTENQSKLAKCEWGIFCDKVLRGEMSVTNPSILHKYFGKK